MRSALWVLALLVVVVGVTAALAGCPKKTPEPPTGTEVTPGETEPPTAVAPGEEKAPEVTPAPGEEKTEEGAEAAPGEEKAEEGAEKAEEAAPEGAPGEEKTEEAPAEKDTE